MSPMHPVLKKWFIIFITGVVVALLGAGIAVGALIGYIDQLPPLDALDNYNPPEITRIYDRTGNTQLAQYFSERREVVRVRDIPEHVINAFLAIEDERFYKHFGVDIEGIIRAVKTNLESGNRVQGASTITMQVVRNVVHPDRKKRLSRKVREALTALQIERRYSKEQILEFYLNQIFFGARAYGIQAASKAYFSKDVKDLTIPEAAMLAALPKAPNTLDPTHGDPEKTRDRRNLVLRNMRKCGFVKSDEELKRLMDTPIELSPPPPTRTEAPYFADYARAVLMRDNAMQESNELGDKGYSVVSTVDLNLQRICEEELSKGLRVMEKKIEEQKEDRLAVEGKSLGGLKRSQNRLARIKSVKDRSMVVSVQGRTAEVPLPEKLPYFNPEAIIKPGNLVDIYVQDIKKDGKIEAYLFDKAHVQGAAVLLDVRTGEILALVGGDDYDDDTNNGKWNRAWQGARQPGSCWKPLLYAAAFDVTDSDGKLRFSPSYIEIDEPIPFPDGYNPKNYEGRSYGPTCLYEALVKSRNIPTIRLFMDIGPRKAVPLYHKFNVVTRPSNWVLDPVPSMPLGTPDIAALDLTAAYAAIGNSGLGIRPTPFRRIYSTKSPSDSRVERPEQFRVISPQAAYITVRIMQDVVAMGTAKTTVGKWIEEQKAKGRKLPEIAGKTGTTNECKVAWFIGYTPDIALGIYVSYDQNRSMGPKIVGGGHIGPIWVPMMDRVLQTRDNWRMKFDVPSDIEFRDICSKSGKRATASCYASGNSVFQNAAFKIGTAPGQDCDYHAGQQMGTETGTEMDIEGSYQIETSPATERPQSGWRSWF